MTARRHAARLLVLGALTFGCASYPARYPRLGDAALAARAEGLRRVSGGVIDAVKLDPYGFVIELRSRPLAPSTKPMPWLDPGTIASWMGGGQGLPGPFGLTSEPRSTFFTYEVNSLEARQVVAGNAIGRIDVRYFADIVPRAPAAWTMHVTGHFWPGAAIPGGSKVHAADVEAQVVGRTYDTLTQPGPAPCPVGAPCPLAAPYEGTVTVTHDMIRSVELVAAVRLDERAPLELRRVLLVDVVQPNGQTTFRERGRAPRLPHAVDIVTGEDLSAWEWCRMVDGACFPWTVCWPDCGPTS